MDLFEAVRSRRSIRHYRPDPVDDKKIESVLEAGRWAPSWGNSQCWRFVVVRDAKVRAALADTLMKIKLPDKEVPNPAAGAVNTAPVIIVVCARTGRAGAAYSAPGSQPEYVTDKGDWFMFDAALAVQNMVLAAHAQGLGTVIIGAFDAARVERILNVPAGCRAVVMFPLGVPEHEGKAPPRKELSEIVFKDKFG